MRSEVPLLAVSLALEAKASQRELTSRLLADLRGPVLTCRDLESAFDKLLWELPDLVLDTPGAPQVKNTTSISYNICPHLLQTRLHQARSSDITDRTALV